MTTTVYVVTPSFNAVGTIDRTIQSVLSQAGDFRIRYHVQDGGSTDGTRERLAWWQGHLRAGGLRRQCHGLRFSFASEPDKGMYDALVRGFDAVDAPVTSFMTWINADDILMPGAIALASGMERQFSPAELSWFGGAVCVLGDDMITSTYDRPIPREALRLGLCNGKYWEFIQQEGTFFRKWLWNSVNPAETIGPMKLAGDWNLWRLMAEQASFAQFPVPLGGFRTSAAQLSASQRDKYEAEIEALGSDADRRMAFEKFCAAGPVTRRRIKPRGWRDSGCDIVEENIDYAARARYQSVFGEAPPWAARTPKATQTLHKGKVITHTAVDPEDQPAIDITSALQKTPGSVTLDAGWQFPAITEQHAWHRIQASMKQKPSGVLYVGYPWATLIDKLQSRAIDRDEHLEAFEDFCAELPDDVIRVTVCQHIYAEKFIHLFRQAGIHTVFWSHATRVNVSASPQGKDAVRFRPFPLYPVQVPEALSAAQETGDESRPYLFSFIGARANEHYLTKSRNWILDFLGKDPRGLIIGRDGWHYEKIVYDLQVKGGGHTAQPAGMIDNSASEKFRDSLLQTTFALCPSGSGPNSIRLWESLGAGSIPVILADTWAPPGDPRLWENAVVFCKETPEAIKALPDRLAEIAADPEKLAQMRHAMRQIWLLYGPQSFVTDVQAFLLSHADRPATDAAGEGLARAMAEQDGPALLLACAGELLLDPAVTRGRIAADPALAAALRKAREALPDDAGLARHYDAVSAHAARVAPQPAALARPAVQRKAALKIGFFGRHAKRTPLSYAPIRRLVGERLETVNTPEKADVLVTGFNIDLRENIETLQPLLKSAKKPKIAVLSEEPLWDITWSGPFTGRAGKISVKGVNIDYAFLGHETSDIYEFERIPYFVLTSETYAVRYANMMARFRTVSPQTLLDRWNRAPISAAFFAESRKGSAYANIFPERDVAGLSAYRTELAEAAEGPNVLRVGKGWGAEKPRQDLPDWHLDKLAQLDGRTRILSAVENVHQRLYISEKIFDAFAVGAVPVYWAGPKHRIFELVPQDSMLNCHGLTQKEAAARIAQFVPDVDFAGTWLGTCARLAALFGDAQAIQKERQRVADATLEAILAVA